MRSRQCCNASLRILAISPDSIWIAYTNGADSTGLSGTSTVVQYDLSGNITNQYPIPGYVDGLRYDAERDLIWILQNQDGNAALMLLRPSTKAFSAYTYAVKSATRGYDDVAFINGQIFMSYTNPMVATDPTIQVITGTSPNITVATILTMGATGT